MSEQLECLVIWPGAGSTWLSHCEVEPSDEYGHVIVGDVWEGIGGGNTPDGGPYGEWQGAWFPLSCILRVEPALEVLGD